MKKLWIFIILIVVGAGLYFGPIVYKKYINPPVVSSKTLKVLPRTYYLHSERLAAPKKETIDGWLDTLTKGVALAVAVSGLVGTTHQARKVRKSRKKA